MPKGSLPAKAWAEANTKLSAISAPYRLRERSGSPYISIRYLDERGKELKQFSLKPLLTEDMADIGEALRLCLDAVRQGQWPGESAAGAAAPRISFQELSERTQAHVDSRLKASSSAHTRGHLRQLATIPGHVTIERLKSWTMQVPPTQLSAYEKRLGTLSAIGQVVEADPVLATILDIQALLVDLRRLKPKGGELKRIKDSRRKPKAIPTDQQLEAWLDAISDPLLQWTFALIATYGLRPSEAWHALPIDEHGWITIPGDQLTKTATHVATALPMAWVERYQLRARFDEMQQRLRERWQIKWTDLGGRQVPNNNTGLSNYLYKQFQLRGQAKLWARAWDGNGEDWCRPYDLRHAYAVRCWSHEESRRVPMAEHAEWMGHGLALHRSTYLKWMSPEARAAAARARAAQPGSESLVQPNFRDTITPELIELAKQLIRTKAGNSPDQLDDRRE